MPMNPVVKVDAVMPYVTDMPRDVAINTFHFQAEVMEGAQQLAIEVALGNFYNDVQASGFSVANFISAYVSRVASACKFIEYSVPELPEVGPRHYGSPIGETTWTLGGAGTDESLPFEVSLCSSYKSNFSLVPRARQRGRVFIGPLTFDAINPNADSPSRPTDDFQDTLKQASAGLRDDAALVANDVQWGVWSNGSNVAPATIARFFPITDGWVDNEWDTQRRRGTEANVRGVW